MESRSQRKTASHLRLVSFHKMIAARDFHHKNCTTTSFLSPVTLLSTTLSHSSVSTANAVPSTTLSSNKDLKQNHYSDPLTSSAIHSLETTTHYRSTTGTTWTMVTVGNSRPIVYPSLEKKPDI